MENRLEQIEIEVVIMNTTKLIVMAIIKHIFVVLNRCIEFDQT
jgi:hypothetical protein